VIRLAASAVAAAAVAVAACSPEEGCQPREPERMPNGSELKSVARSIDGAATVLVWRSGESFVLQRIFVAGAPGELACPSGQLAGETDCLVPAGIEVRGHPAVLEPGNPEETTWLLAWAEGDCRYETVFGRMRREDVEAYAVGY
jgi:hypothetical protein